MTHPEGFGGIALIELEHPVSGSNGAVSGILLQRGRESLLLREESRIFGVWALPFGGGQTIDRVIGV